MRKSVTLFVMLMLCGALAFAQNRTISGTVRDDAGAPVPFATVSEEGTKNATTADANGNFTIKMKGNGDLSFTATGFNAATATPEGNSVTVSLKRNAAELTTVVVTTALGQVRQSKDLGYSTAKVKAQELTQAKVVNLENGLTGKVSGLNIQTVNNGVFADTRITLRGIRSLTGNNQPMLIWDGVPISLSYINSINPNDIADVSILKSASATAVYGPEGVNGAIVITSKKGSKQNPTITVGHTIQLETVSFLPKFQTGFGEGSSVDAYGNGVFDPIENQTYGPAFDGSIVQIGRDAPDGSKNLITYVARPDEKKKFWNTGITNQTDVSFATGDFYVSAQNVDIQGILPKDQNHRQTIHLSANKEYNKFKASYSINYTHDNYNVNAGQNFGNGRDFTPYWNYINTPIDIPLTRYKNWNSTDPKDYFSTNDGYFNDYYSNPYWAIDNFREKGRSDDILGNLTFDYKLASWINLTYRLGATITDASSKGTQGSLTYSQFSKDQGKSIALIGDIPSAVYDNSSFSTRLASEFFVTLKKQFNSFKIDALLGQSFVENNSKAVNVGSNNLGIPSVYNVVVRKGEPDAGESNSKQRLERFFGRVSIGFNDWIFGEFTGSYDIDSRLGNPYNFNIKDVGYFYPGGSLSLVLSDAIPGLKNSNTLSFLKLRGAYSKTGNVNLGIYSLENTFNPGENFPYGTLLGFSSSDVLRRDSYKPEFVINKEVGLEVGFLQNRINLEATAYQQDNSNQIIQVSYSASTGYPAALLNAASFTNKGLEFDLKFTPLIKINKVSIDLKANYTYQTNKVTSLIEGVNELGIGNGNYAIIGYPAYTFKLTDYVRDSLGRAIVNKTTGYPTLDPNQKIFGQTVPKHILGLNLNINWKGFSFAAVADYRGGNQIYTGNLGNGLDFAGISYRSGQNGRQPFIFPNSSYNDGTGKYVANTDVYTQNGGYNFWSQSINTAVNSNYLVDGSFWKLREVSISYALPSSLFTNKGIKGASFTLTGRNLATWLPKTNQWTDPEFSNTIGNAQGVSGLTNTPPTRIFGANVTLQF